MTPSERTNPVPHYEPESERVGIAVKELRERRACLEGAKETLKMAHATVRQGQALDLVRTALLGPLQDRILLVQEAIDNTDAVLDQLTAPVHREEGKGK